MPSLCNELEFWHFEDSLMVFKDGSIGAGFKLGEFDSRKTKFLRSVKGIASALDAARLAPAVLKREEWFKLVFSYLNLERSEKIDTARYREPRNFLNPSISE